jgi:hypothetical protein
MLALRRIDDSLASLASPNGGYVDLHPSESDARGGGVGGDLADLPPGESGEAAATDGGRGRERSCDFCGAIKVLGGVAWGMTLHSVVPPNFADTGRWMDPEETLGDAHRCGPKVVAVPIRFGKLHLAAARQFDRTAD